MILNDLKFGLNEKWGKKYNGGEPYTTAETMKVLANRMSLNTVRNTKLIEITVFSEDKNEAALIANTIAATYRDYRLDLRKQLSTGGIKAMQDEYQDHETQIQALQKNVDQLRKDLHINDTDPFATGPSPTMSPEELRQLNDERIEDRVFSRLGLTGDFHHGRLGNFQIKSFRIDLG